jgi:saccharopine dehydrogenase-like NADP-dependent oxidoreductase
MENNKTQIVVFGAGRSSVALINQLSVLAAKKNYSLIVADADLQHAGFEMSEYIQTFEMDVKDDTLRDRLIKDASIVISLMPSALHYVIAKDCLLHKKNLLTASYVDEKLAALKEEIEKSGVLFLCEMGLDPGIDHMSAMQLFHKIGQENIISFYSHCGGAVAPESDDNPWHYKISWNPRNVVLAGKAGAVFLENGIKKNMYYHEIFNTENIVDVPVAGLLSWYPNRDSLEYINTYGLKNATTFIRTTLRHPDFMYGWNNMIELDLVNEDKIYDTTNMSLKQFFKLHFDNHNFANWLQQKMTRQFEQAKELMEKLMELQEMQDELSKEKDEEQVENIMMVKGDGELEEVSVDDIRINAASAVADNVHKANLALKQLFYLGMEDDVTIINKGICSAADILQFALENKLALKANDRDMIVMMHEVAYKKNNKVHYLQSSLVVKGNDSVHTAMAKTVGLPLAIAAGLILDGTINLKGLHIPVLPEIYEPVLKALEEHGIIFHEKEIK